MEQKDLSVLSLKELRQMLEAITFNKNRDGDALRDNKGVEEKSEAQVEAKMVARLRKANEVEKLVEANVISEIILGNIDVETGEKAEKEPNEQATKRAEDLEAEQQLKLQPFSAEEKFEEVVGDDGREKMNAENFSVGAAKPHDSRNIPYTNVAERESNKEMKKRRSVERAQARCWRYDKRQRDRWKVWFNLSTPMTLQPRDVAESVLNADEKNQILKKNKGFRFNKTQHFTIGPEYFSAQSYFYLQLMHVTERNRSISIVSAIATSDIPKKSLLLATYGKPMIFLPLFGVHASRRKKLSISSATSKLLGVFLHWRDADSNGLIQPSRSGKNQQIGHHRLLFIVDDKKKDFGAIGTAKTKKNGTAVVSFLLALTFSHLFDTNTARGGTSTHLIPEFMCSGLIEAICWDVLSKKGAILLSNVNTAREGGYNFAFCLNGVSGSAIFAHPASLFIGLDLFGEILWITVILEEIHWRDIRAVRWVPSLCFYVVLCHLGEFSCLLTVEAMRRQERIDASLSLASLSKPGALPTLYDTVIPRKGEIRGLANYKWVFEVIFWLSKKNQVISAKVYEDKGERFSRQEAIVWAVSILGQRVLMTIFIVQVVEGKTLFDMAILIFYDIGGLKLQLPSCDMQVSNDNKVQKLRFLQAMDARNDWAGYQLFAITGDIKIQVQIDGYKMFVFVLDNLSTFCNVLELQLAYKFSISQLGTKAHY